MLIEPNYLITKETALMYAVYDESGYENCMVHEQYRKLKILKPVKEVLKDNCKYHGCTLEGKLDAAKEVLKGKRMLPLCLSITFRICLFPTHSADKSENMWISVNHIRDILPYKGESIMKLEIVKNLIMITDPPDPTDPYDPNSGMDQLH